ANALAYIGLRFAGWRGALASYVAFVLPGLAAVLVLAWAYVRFGTTPNLATLLGGFNAAVVGIIATITLKMVRTSVSRLWQMGVAALALLFSAVGSAPPGEIVLAAIAVGLAVDLGTKRARLASVRRRRKTDVEPPVALPEEGQPLEPPAQPPSGGGSLSSPWPLAIVGLLAAVHLTGIDAELLRLVLAGAALDRLRSRRFVRAALRGLTPAVLGLMAAAAIALGDQLSGEAEIGIAGAVALTLTRFPVNPAMMLLLGGVTRLLLRMVRL